MPIYSYLCERGHETEERREFGDHRERRQIYHPPLVQYRRRGWRPYHPEGAAKNETVKEEICVSD
jgi:hypothetical protein